MVDGTQTQRVMNIYPVDISSLLNRGGGGGGGGGGEQCDAHEFFIVFKSVVQDQCKVS